MNNQRFCVYTCLIGNYERLNEQPVALASGVDFICLTDDVSLKSKTWRLVKINPIFKRDPIRSHRVVKLSPHDYFMDYDITLYIDNSLSLLAKPEDIFDRYSAHCDFLLPTHSFRDSVLDEFTEVKKLSLDDLKRVDEQLAHYKDTDANCLNEKPYWAGVLIRRHSNDGVRNAMRIWLAHVCRYSRRDQLSANYAFRQAGVMPYRLNIDNYSSWFHKWPVHIDRKENMRRFNNLPKQTDATSPSWRDWMPPIGLRAASRVRSYLRQFALRRSS